ncbi:hypothetical protein [Polaromonas sp.]|uniref:hypothetical protein n=1 Tax=Polaromonas sp. TaxID=1869339 RepID=UPI00352AFA64
MKLSLTLIALVSLFPLSSKAENGLDSDGVPKIDVRGHAEVVKIPKLVPLGKPPATEEVEKRVVTVGGKDMSLIEFYRTYCIAKPMTNGTCMRAAKISDLDSLGRINGKLRPLPAGL